MDNILFNNWGKKLLAVIISLLLWLVTNLEFDIVKNVDIKLNFINLKQNLIISNNPPETVNLRIRGPRSQLSAVNKTNTSLDIDLMSIDTGVSKLEIDSNQLSLPNDVNVTSINPSDIELIIDTVTTKAVKVVPVLTNPDKGVNILKEPASYPKLVTIKGPSEMIQDMESIETTPISLKGESSEFTIQVPLSPPNPLIQIVESNLVRVRVHIEEINLQKEFKDVEISFKNFDDINYKPIGNTKVQLVFDGPYNLINDLTSSEIEVFIDGEKIKKDKSGTQSFKIMVNYPNSNSLKLTKLTPKTIRIKIN